jgi:phosphatidylglycerol lysyltransferase
MRASDADRRRALDLVRRHGWNALAFQALGDEFAYFFRGDGCVAYVDTGSAWVAAGAPVTASAELAETGRAFVLAAKRAGRRACFFGTELRFGELARDFTRSIWIGEQPVWNPAEWPATLARHSSLREQLRRARAKGVRAREVEVDELHSGTLRARMAELSERWLATRAMPPLGFLVRLTPAVFANEVRLFVAEREGRVLGIARVIPVPQRGGWFIEHLLREPRAPNGTVETLVDAVMRWAAREGSTFLTLGLAPLAGKVPLVLRAARRGLPFLYDFEGLRRFKAKLCPSEWSPILLTFPNAQGSARTIIDVLSAFAHDGLLWFGVRTVARGPSVVLTLLALLLVPWTFLIGVAPLRFFGGFAEVQWAWVLFDAALVVALVALLRRPSVRLATLLAVAVTLDAVVTFVEAAFTSEIWRRGGFDACVVAVACVAPAFAAVVLWGARRRLRKLLGSGPSAAAAPAEFTSA